MSFTHAFLIALIQGVTEFLPISSAGHLILLDHLSSAARHGLVIDVAAHLGTLCAAMIYFRKEVSSCVVGATSFVLPVEARQETRQLVLFVLLASVPIGVAGALLFFTGWIDFLRDIKIIAAANLIFAGLLFWADRRPETKLDLSVMNWRQAGLIGLAQMAALIPGASRAGVCISMARYFGFSRSVSARLALFLAIPSIGGAVILSAAHIENTVHLGEAAYVAFLSFVAAFLVLSVFIRMSRHFSLTPFVIYRLILAAVLFML